MQPLFCLRSLNSHLYHVLPLFPSPDHPAGYAWNPHICSLTNAHGWIQKLPICYTFIFVRKIWNGAERFPKHAYIGGGGEPLYSICLRWDLSRTRYLIARLSQIRPILVTNPISTKHTRSELVYNNALFTKKERKIRTRATQQESYLHATRVILSRSLETPNPAKSTLKVCCAPRAN